MRPNCVIGSSPRRSARSRRATHPLPPRWSLARPVAPKSCWWRHRPYRSGSPRDRAPPARRESCHPSAPSRQSVPCAPADDGVPAASALGSTTPPPTSSAAAFPHPSAVHPPRPSAPPPASDRNARPRAHRTSPAPDAAPSAETSRREHDSRSVLRCHASDPQPLVPDTASTTASLAGSSGTSAAPHPPPATAGCALGPAPRLAPTPSGSSLSASIRPPFGGRIKGTFLSRTKGDIIIEVQHFISLRKANYTGANRESQSEFGGGARLAIYANPFHARTDRTPEGCGGAPCFD